MKLIEMTAKQLDWDNRAEAFLNKLEDLNLSPEFQDEYVWIVTNGGNHD